MQWSILIQLSNYLKLGMKIEKKASKNSKTGTKYYVGELLICLWQNTGSSGGKNEENIDCCPVQVSHQDSDSDLTSPLMAMIQIALVLTSSLEGPV